MWTSVLECVVKTIAWLDFAWSFIVALFDHVLPWNTPFGNSEAKTAGKHEKYVLVLDLDETLVHTTDRAVPSYDCRVEISSPVNQSKPRVFYVLKRPFLDLFLTQMSMHFEIVVFTASIRRYADAVIDLIDPNGYIAKRCFRPDCTPKGAHFVKDISKVSSDLAKVVIVDNSPICYSNHPDNAVPIPAWFNDPDDTALLSLIPFLIALRSTKDVRSLLRLRLIGPDGKRLHIDDENCSSREYVSPLPRLSVADEMVSRESEGVGPRIMPLTPNSKRVSMRFSFENIKNAIRKKKTTVQTPVSVVQNNVKGSSTLLGEWDKASAVYSATRTAAEWRASTRT